MNLGLKESTMSLKTRLDGRTIENSSIQIKNEEGDVMAEVKLLDSSGSTLEITTKKGLYIEKPNGWNSKQKKIDNNAEVTDVRD
jgi:hypothetical protein